MLITALNVRAVEWLTFTRAASLAPAPHRQVSAVFCRRAEGTRPDLDNAAVCCLRRQAVARSIPHCRQRQRLPHSANTRLFGREFVAIAAAGRRQEPSRSSSCLRPRCVGRLFCDELATGGWPPSITSWLWHPRSRQSRSSSRPEATSSGRYGALQGHDIPCPLLPTKPAPATFSSAGGATPYSAHSSSPSGLRLIRPSSSRKNTRALSASRSLPSSAPRLCRKGGALQGAKSKSPAWESVAALDLTATDATANASRLIGHAQSFRCNNRWSPGES